MKRTIKFRGYNKKNNKWIYGYYLVNRGQHFIAEDGIANPLNTWEDYLVEEDTIGQFTGLLDMGGVEIYEGDIVRVTYPNEEPKEVEVVYSESDASYIAYMGCERLLGLINAEFEVINGKEIQNENQRTNDR